MVKGYSLYDRLPDEVYPKVRKARNNDGTVSLVRDYDIVDGYIYREYLEEVRGYDSFDSAFAVVSIEFTVLEFGNVSFVDLQKYYPGILKYDESKYAPLDSLDSHYGMPYKSIVVPYEGIFHGNPITSVDIQKPLVKVSIDERILEGNEQDIHEDLLELVKNLCTRVDKLEKENAILSEYLRELSQGDVPPDFSTLLLEDLFDNEENT